MLFDCADEAGRKVLVEVRVNRAGGDAVDADAIIAEDDGKIAGEDIEPGFCRVVWRVVVLF